MGTKFKVSNKIKVMLWAYIVIYDINPYALHAEQLIPDNVFPCRYTINQQQPILVVHMVAIRN